MNKPLRDFHLALGVAMIVVLAELGVITWVRHRFMDTAVFSAAMQVGLGGALVFLTGISHRKIVTIVQERWLRSDYLRTGRCRLSKKISQFQWDRLDSSAWHSVPVAVIRLRTLNALQ
jgi:hypothetical protein